MAQWGDEARVVFGGADGDCLVPQLGRDAAEEEERISLHDSAGIDENGGPSNLGYAAALRHAELLPVLHHGVENRTQLDGRQESHEDDEGDERDTDNRRPEVELAGEQAAA